MGCFPCCSAGVTLTNIIDIPAVNNLKVRGELGCDGQQAQ